MGVFDWLGLVAGLFGAGDAPDGTLDSLLENRTHVEAADIRVIDGDTIRYAGGSVRLTGFDTPETFEPGCAYERALGQAATRRLTELVESGQPLLLVMSGQMDRYGRDLGRLFVDGEDAGDILVQEALARAYIGGRRETWCAPEGEAAQ